MPDALISAPQAIVSRKDRILRAALHLFCRNDYSAVKTREIAELADVSLRLMWHHFKSKDELRASVDELVLTAIGHVAENSSTPDTGQSEFERIMLGMSTISQRYGADFIYYWRRMLVDEGERGSRAFSMLRSWCDEYIRFPDPENLTPEDRHRELAIMSLFSGAVFLKPHIEQLYEVDIHSPKEYRFRTKAVKDAVEILLQPYRTA